MWLMPFSIQFFGHTDTFRLSSCIVLMWCKLERSRCAQLVQRGKLCAVDGWDEPACACAGSECI